MVSKLNPVISNGAGQAAKGFIYNKDADTFQCPAGNVPVRKAVERKKNGTGKNQVLTYYYEIKKCKVCPHKEGYYKEGAKSKTYNITILSETHKEQKRFQETEYFKERTKQRYMIEAKNAELKQAHGLEKADSVSVVAMRLQSYFTAFVVNVKRIVKLAKKEAA